MAGKRTKIVLTTAQLQERLELAASTLRRLPSNGGPKGYGSSWPDVVRSSFAAYGYSEATVRVRPSAREIQIMEETFPWMLLIDNPDDRHIVWMRAENRPWREIQRRVGLSRSQAWRRWTAALLTMQKRLANPPQAARKPGPGAGRKPGSGSGRVTAVPAEDRP